MHNVLGAGEIELKRLLRSAVPARSENVFSAAVPGRPPASDHERRRNTLA